MPIIKLADIHTDRLHAARAQVAEAQRAIRRVTDDHIAGSYARQAAPDRGSATEPPTGPDGPTGPATA